MNKALQHTKSTLKEWREKLRGTPRKSEQDLLAPGDPPSSIKAAPGDYGYDTRNLRVLVRVYRYS